MFAAGRYGEAAEVARQAIEDNPEFADSYGVLAASCGQAGSQDAARVALDELRQRMPDLATADERLNRPFKRAVDKEQFLDGLRKAGL